MKKILVPFALLGAILSKPTVSSGEGLELLGSSRDLLGEKEFEPRSSRIILIGIHSGNNRNKDGTFGLLPANYRAIRRAVRTSAPLRSSYPWKTDIVTTVFWIGEDPSPRNPIPNYMSSWDCKWTSNYGGLDSPDPVDRVDYRPKRFIPRQNPFYIALPYNDISTYGTKAEAAKVIPWFNETFEKSGLSVLKGRWVAIRKGSRIAYAQWEDCGPFRTDHWEYVFGKDRPKPNANRGAGLDVSPAVRDYLALSGTDITDWRFVEDSEVPSGPWRAWGDNNPFVRRQPLSSNRLASTAVETNCLSNPLFDAAAR